MKVIGILAQKGGVGKTTLALHWAVEAGVPRGASAAVVDIDYQGSSTSWYQRREKDTPMMLQASENNVRDAVQVCKEQGINWVFIDTMPRVERSSLEAAKVADMAVIPCGPTVLDIEAVGSTVEIVQQARVPAVIVVNQGRPGSPINERAAKVLAQYGLPVCPVQVMRRAVLADAFTDGRAVRELVPTSKAAEEIINSWNWIKKRMGGG